MRFLRFASQESRHVAIAGARPNFVVALMNLPILSEGVELRSGANPFAGKKAQVLTVSQERAKRKNRIYSKRKYGN